MSILDILEKKGLNQMKLNISTNWKISSSLMLDTWELLSYFFQKKNKKKEKDQMWSKLCYWTKCI